MTQPPQGTAYVPASGAGTAGAPSDRQDAWRTHRARHRDGTCLQQAAWLEARHGSGYGHATALVADTLRRLSR